MRFYVCTGMKNVEIRMRRRNYVNHFSNFQVNILINDKFHTGRGDESNHMNNLVPRALAALPATPL